MRVIRTAFANLFVMAGGIAIVAVPLQVLLWIPDYFSVLSVLPIPQRSFWHGHALLVGYSQVVLGGYLLTRPGNRVIVPFSLFWLIAQISIFIPEPAGIYIGTFASISVFALLFIHAGLQFFRAAKRWKSALPGLVIGLLLLSEIIFQAGQVLQEPSASEVALRGVIWLLIILVFLMGGRIIAAATSGALQKRDMYQPYMAQGRLETYGVIALLVTGLSDLLVLPVAITTFFGAVAATIIARRLWNWRVWRVIDAFDLTSLHMGYAMLAIGLIFYICQISIGDAPSLVGLHGVMIGGFALLSITIMCRTVLQRLRFALVLPITMRIASVCILGAAITRMAAFQTVGTTEFLIASSLLWVAAFTLFLSTLVGIIWRFYKQPSSNGPPQNDHPFKT
ncbi:MULTISPECIES: NnrS family protein [Thalassospira]|uniref:NnrS family protein n=2 Tax=Thalassospira TaxID=168934 RepID=A0A367W841_9PROT|nr:MULTISPECIES: NnrS family protein [Thalassospira]MDG4720426.1 NnrS family protein [Thalassospira sp. FZY0004]RCK37593.1 hypothetical protein TH19_10100 [Thalassospira profundimaris]